MTLLFIVLITQTIAALLKMLQPPADVVLEDYVLMGEEYAKWMAQYSQASMKYYAENRHTMIADVVLQGNIKRTCYDNR